MNQNQIKSLWINHKSGSQYVYTDLIKSNYFYFTLSQFVRALDRIACAAYLLMFSI